MKNKKIRNFLKKIFGLSIISFYLIFGISKNQNFNDLKTNLNPILFSPQTEHNLKKVIIDCINSAKSSIFLRIYHINDKDIESSLIKKAQENVPINIICHDISKKSSLFQKSQQNPLIHIEPKKIPGSRKLMHIKALTIDDKLTLIGSANLTKQSLTLDKNLIIGFYNKTFCKSIINNIPCNITQNNQEISLKINPKQSQENLSEIKNLILNAKKTIKIGMYVFSLPQLIDVLEIAHNKGVSVEVIINNTHAYLTKKLIEKKNITFPIFVKTSPNCLHHKFAWIDDKILIFGSANWTHYGFYYNDEYILYLYNLTLEQQQKMNKIWIELNLCKRPLIDRQEENNIIYLFRWIEKLFQKVA